MYAFQCEMVNHELVESASGCCKEVYMICECAGVQGMHQIIKQRCCQCMRTTGSACNCDCALTDSTKQYGNMCNAIVSWNVKMNGGVCVSCNVAIVWCMFVHS